MKEKLRNKKVVYTIIGIVSVLLVALAVTYAYWLVTKTQDKENVISSACLDIAISGEKNDITLSNQFPMSDEDGMKLTPYEFTVTNNCNTSVDYQVALEAIGESSNALSATSLKVALDDSVSILSENAQVETTISGAYESRKLAMDTLASKDSDGSSATYNLRIWIDEDAPISEMNKTFKSRISVTVGQNINAPLKIGTLAYQILDNNGGANSVNVINSEWTQGIFGSESSTFFSKNTFYYWGTEYTFNKQNGQYSLGGVLTKATVEECRNGTKNCGQYTLRIAGSFNESSSVFEVVSWTSSKADTSGSYYITAKEARRGTNAFSLSQVDSGLYKTQDDLGESYYFRGNVTNNYVEFGMNAENSYKYVPCYAAEMGGEECNDYVGYTTLDECQASGATSCKNILIASAEDPMYWRVVRINGDGTIRLAYYGSGELDDHVNFYSDVASTPFNKNNNDKKYVGYTYDDGTGKQIDSTIKGVIDAWYDKHLKETYGIYIADAIFCNDRSILREVHYASGNIATDSPSEGGYSIYEPGAYVRLYFYQTPSLKCANKSDRYTVDDVLNGNGLLTNPVGLITADELAFSGSLQSNSYFKTNNNYWTMSPSSMGENNIAVYGGYSGGGMFDSFGGVTLGAGARPVINIKADVKFTGDGTIDNPYKIVTE